MRRHCASAERPGITVSEQALEGAQPLIRHGKATRLLG
jgi:hypothetical protein